MVSERDARKSVTPDSCKVAYQSQQAKFNICILPSLLYEKCYPPCFPRQFKPNSIHIHNITLYECHLLVVVLGLGASVLLLNVRNKIVFL